MSLASDNPMDLDCKTSIFPENATAVNKSSLKSCPGEAKEAFLINMF